MNRDNNEMDSRDHLPIGTIDYATVRGGFYAKHYTGISLFAFPGGEDIAIYCPTKPRVNDTTFRIFISWLESLFQYAGFGDVEIHQKSIKDAIAAFQHEDE